MESVDPYSLWYIDILDELNGFKGDAACPGIDGLGSGDNCFLSTWGIALAAFIL